MSRGTRATAAPTLGPRARSGAGPVQRTAAVVLGACLSLTSCTSGQGQEGAGVEATVTASAPIPSDVTAAPMREAREGWKIFSDPSRSVSFELPEAWVVQPLQPELADHAPDSLHYAVRTREGVTTAELHTGILTEEPPCPDVERTPYHVIGSEPLQLTETSPPATDMGPRFVTRLITGFRFFGSYGITDQAGGADSLACSLTNTVDGGAGLGRVSFGDLEVLAPKLPADTGPQTVTFGTIAEAETYYGTPEFATIREMILSIRFSAPSE